MAKKRVEDAERKAAEKAEVKALRMKLAQLQQPLKEAGIPLIVVFEGWSASGKGSMIAQMISELDPRNYRVYSNSAPTDADLRRPFLWTFWNDLPPRGNLSVLEGSWYRRGLSRYREGDPPTQLIRSILNFEEQLCADGYLIVKFFLNITREEQRRRLEKLADRDETAWRVTERDWQQNRRFDILQAQLYPLMEATNTAHAPWYQVENNEKNSGVRDVLRILIEHIETALRQGAPKPRTHTEPQWPLLPMPRLDQVDLTPAVDEETYRKEKDKEKKKLLRLHSRLYREKVPVILCFEGWDAAGKGGAIRRLSWALDPRGFDVIPVAAPTPEALSRHYLWRFWTTLPKDGHAALYDRTWYGRVLVERVEQLTPEERWSQAYDEINAFERDLTEWGAIVLKFWIHIDPETQLERFRARQADPSKQYKITDEDWRNREKWPLYEAAVNEMLQKTSTETAPWYIVPGNDKKYARLFVMKTIRKALEQRRR